MHQVSLQVTYLGLVVALFVDKCMEYRSMKVHATNALEFLSIVRQGLSDGLRVAYVQLLALESFSRCASGSCK